MAVVQVEGASRRKSCKIGIFSDAELCYRHPFVNYCRSNLFVGFWAPDLLKSKSITGTPEVCRIITCWAISRGLGVIIVLLVSR